MTYAERYYLSSTRSTSTADSCIFHCMTIANDEGFVVEVWGRLHNESTAR
jgi:hypothetical protein